MKKRIEWAAILVSGVIFFSSCGDKSLNPESTRDLSNGKPAPRNRGFAAQASAVKSETGSEPEAWQVNQAVEDLASIDYVKVRQAILTIEKNIGSPNTKRAVDPLIQIAKNSNGLRDAYTRTLAVPVLFRIGILYYPSSQSRKAINGVINLLHNSSADLVRGACAHSIGVNNYQQAIPDLEEALNDPSVYVQEEACLSLLRMTNYSYSSPKCNPQEGQEGIANSQEPKGNSISSFGAESEDRADLIYNWLRSHLLYPSIDQFQE